MEKFKIKYLIIMLVVIFIGCNGFGFIDTQLMPVVYLWNYFKDFLTPTSLVSNNISVFFLPLIITFLIYDIKISLLYGVSSTILNLIIIKLLGQSINLDSIEYALGLGSFSLIIGIFLQFKKEDNEEKIKIFKYFLFAAILSRLFSIVVPPAINFGIASVPITYDVQAAFIDNFLNIPKSTNPYLYFINEYISNDSNIYNLFKGVYGLLAIAIMGLAAFEYKNRNKYHRFYVNTLLVASIGSTLGVLMYYLYPVMGPGYFETTMKTAFPTNSDWRNHLGSMLTGSNFARNGMPSLHIAFSLFMFLNTRKTSFPIRSLFLVFFILTALSTLILGEHYIIDWIISPSVVIVTMCLSAIELSWKDKLKVVKINVLFMLSWYIFLWFGVKWISNIYGCIGCSSFNWTMTIILYAFIISSLIIFLTTYKKFNQLGDDYYQTNGINEIDAFNVIKDWVKNSDFKISKHILSYLFIGSGFAGLMYQVTFGKMLGTIFGSTSIAIYIVLATYMIGLSLGAWIGGREKSTISPLLKYAFCELAIGLYCLLTPIIFHLIDLSYLSIAKNFSENIHILTILKIVFGILGLLIPTTLMGMTTPILLKNYNDEENKAGLSIAHLYTLNTLGAALGAVLAGYLIIPSIGVKNTIFLTVLINLIIGIQAIQMFKKKHINEEHDVNQYVKDFLWGVIYSFKQVKLDITQTFNFKVAVCLLFVSGVVTMSLETLFVHGLAIVVGNSTYAFSIMLFTFLLGLSLGGWIGKQLIDNGIKNNKVIALLEFLLGLSIFISFTIFDLVPEYVAGFEKSVYITLFSQKEFIRALICFCIMILPTIITGSLYTILMHHIANGLNKEQGEKAIGFGIAINTVGNIFGVFIGGLLLVNIFGLILGLKILIAPTFICSIIPLLKDIKTKQVIISACSLIILIIYPFKLNMDGITSGANVYFNNSSRGHVIEYAESVDGGLTSINQMKIKDKEVITLLTNGKFQGNNAGEIYAQGGFAIAPLMHLTHDDNALVIGYGTGMTSRVIHDYGFKSMDIVDLSPDVLKLSDKYFQSINQHVRTQLNVRTHINDGRNFLQLTNKKYDLISMEISSIWFAGASYLYNKEFYQIAKQKMTNDGVLQQWVQLHHMAPQDFFVILNTVRSEFKYVDVYFIGDQGIIVATNSENSMNAHQENIDKMNHNLLLNDVKKFYKNDFGSIRDLRLLDNQQTDKVLLSLYGRAMPLFYSTDNNLYLEYNTPKGNAIQTDTITQTISIIKQKR